MAMWQKELCSCFDDCGTSFVTYFFPCYTFGNNAATLDPSNNTCLCACLYCLAMEFGVHTCMGCWLRGKIRERNNIDGGPVGDFCSHCWCACCALVQEAQELKTTQSQGHLHHGSTTIITSTTTTQPGYGHQQHTVVETQRHVQHN